MSSMADWMAILRAQVDTHGQAATAARLRYSSSVVSQVLSGTYRGRVDRVAQRVIEVYGGLEVSCPVLGTIELSRCAEERLRPFAATNPLRVRLYRACQGCPNNPNRREDLI